MTCSILVTGGAGFIGSHTCVALLEAGHHVTVLDNLSNSSAEAIRRVERLTGREVLLEEADLTDAVAVDGVMSSGRFDSVIHFAGLKAVAESTQVPLHYYANNVSGTLILLESMARHGITRLVFSSSATVYGEPASVPVTEDFPLSATNPYGRTKLMIEQILSDVTASDSGVKFISLRYFNPAGAHPSGLIGEDPLGIPNNLMPNVMQVAAGRRPALKVYGTDYPTRDGTAVRDYIHVMDLAQGHLAALDALEGVPGCVAVNLGTGRGSTVLEVIAAASRAVGADIAYETAPRRPGDVAETYADASRAERELGWRASRTLDDMCRDAWHWQSQNPGGYSA
ncbi:MAG TPA: UDP-glucose 4-epimerase GalE [Actinomycetota bacterium]|nr:UDP-glucose 4-epimerase GalE [Actinomycetota bacterium]